MPSYKTHIVGGIGVFLILLQLTKSLDPDIPLDNIVLFLLASVVGSLFPDIDVKSKMQRYFYLSALMILPITMLTKAWHLFFITAGVCSVIPILQHRTITHQSWFIITIPGLIALALAFHYNLHFNTTMFTYLFFAGGALSHIFLDKTLTRIKKTFSWRQKFSNRKY